MSIFESLTAIAQQAVELAQNITVVENDFEAAGILALVKEFLGNINLDSISALVQGIIGIAG